MLRVSRLILAALIMTAAAAALLFIDAAGSSPPAQLKVNFYGRIEELPDTPDLTGTWQVEGRKVVVDRSTRIKPERGPIRVGAYVEVEGILQPDGSVYAWEMEVKWVP